MKARLRVAYLGLAVILSCSSSEPPSPSRCIEGASVECSCTDGRRGAQNCQNNGTLAACVCMSPPPPAENVVPPAVASASQATASVGCDISGSWSVMAKSTNAKCGKREIMDDWLITGGPDKWGISRFKELPVRMKSAKKDSGGCRVKLFGHEEECPSCVPSEKYFEWVIDAKVANGATMTGQMTYTKFPSWDAADEGAKPCVQRYTITGRRQDTAFKTESKIPPFDSEKAKRNFLSLYNDFFYECWFPAHALGVGTSVNADIRITIEGDIDSIKINGQEQAARDNCVERYRPFLEHFQENLTGIAQVVRVPLKLKGAPPPMAAVVEPSTKTSVGSDEKATNISETTKARIAHEIQSHTPAIRACYEEGLSRNPALAGKVTVCFRINQRGTTSAARVDANTTGDSRLGQCMVKEVNRWIFPAPVGGDVTVCYPFAFTSSK